MSGVVSVHVLKKFEIHNNILILYHNIFCKHNNTSQPRNVRIIPFTYFLHTGQSLRARAQSLQDTRWPQGRNTISTWESMQILQSICSRSWTFFSFKSRICSKNRIYRLNILNYLNLHNYINQTHQSPLSLYIYILCPTTEFQLNTNMY